MTTLLLWVALAAVPASHPVLATLPELLPELETLYQTLHREPELSLQEEKTAARLAAELRAVGFEVTTGVGGHGVVGVLRNGKGPTVLLRTDMDALPIKEETGLPYASTATATDASGATVPVMHACGHDLHMAALVGTVTLLSRARDRWRGTIVAVGQPAEELVRGARAMIDDGLLTRFPRPDAALAMHVWASLPAGEVAIIPGPVYATMNSIDIVVHGRGGHGAAPHRTIDPVLIASRIVVALQGIVAREVNPIHPAVVTVGAIEGGTRGNIIPDEVKLRLTVRSYHPDVQRQLIDAIGRVARGEAMAAGAKREPTLDLSTSSTPPVVNDPALTGRIRAVVAGALGEGALTHVETGMYSEDFAEFGHAGIPSVILFVGSARDAAFAAAVKSGAGLGTHTSRYAPELRPALRTGVSAVTLAALAALGGDGKGAVARRPATPPSTATR